MAVTGPRGTVLGRVESCLVMRRHDFGLKSEFSLRIMVITSELRVRFLFPERMRVTKAKCDGINN